MLPLIKKELVENKKWITDRDFIDGIAVCQSVPGAIALNVATFVGNKISGRLGAMVAMLGAALPSFTIIVVISIFLPQYIDMAIVQNFFKGVIPAIVALLVSAIVDIGRIATKELVQVIIAIVLAFLLIYLHMHPALAILIAAVSGLFMRRRP